jgi:hypothetical protein
MESLLTERYVVSLIDGALDCRTFVVSLQNCGDGSDLLFKNIYQDSSLSGSRVWITGLEIICSLIIAVLLNNHVIVFVMTITLVFISFLILLLLSLDVIEYDLV